MKYFINGEIYLKKGPIVFNQYHNLNDKIDDLKFVLSKGNPDLSLFETLEFYEELKEEVWRKDDVIDYSGTEFFWQAFNDNKGVLVTCAMASSLDKIYKSIDEMERDFIKLSDFLDKATFVGRKFRRTKPIVFQAGKVAKMYMSETGEYYHVVLYAMQDLFLVKKYSKIGEEYQLINSQCTMDGNYEFYGEVFNQYADKDMVYREILEQVEHKGRKR